MNTHTQQEQEQARRKKLWAEAEEEEVQAVVAIASAALLASRTRTSGSDTDSEMEQQQRRAEVLSKRKERKRLRNERKMDNNRRRKEKRAKFRAERSVEQLRQFEVDKEQGVSETVDATEKAQYFFWDGQRHVRPYVFQFRTMAKKRWFGKTILEIFSGEFIRYSKEYYEQAISNGTICVNDKPVALDFPVHDGDVITHSVHRHEPPVSDTPVDVVAETDELVVINKPPSMPLHPSGRYRHNSATSILLHERGLRLFTMHRLDRQTSGLVLLAKSSDIVARYAADLQQLKFRKVYLARVKGEFPADKEITVDEPIICVDAYVGQYAVGAAGKPSQTVFKRLKYDGHTSLVQCNGMPITGRTHQIRVHLQHLGYPIANDPCYGGKLYGSNSRSNFRDPKTLSPAETQALEQLKIQDDLQYPGCAECKEGSYWTDQTRYCTHIWLHALSYSGPTWSFTVPQPEWARDDFDSQAACAQEFEVARTRI